MLTRNYDDNQSFNAIEFETKHEQDYYQSCGSFADGDWDARIGIDPSFDAWHSADYRAGYLSGIESKFNEKFDLLD